MRCCRLWLSAPLAAMSCWSPSRSLSLRPALRLPEKPSSPPYVLSSLCRFTIPSLPSLSLLLSLLIHPRDSNR
ncbi:hypothetical protein BS50DRAFT_210205 [Corynespora cassiicola Philippines]|uniref:Secreted protein n=1 Tax=Corynespora cassiicola Philippines TaxID=1448308 RepID=A0A2T2MZ40_CORCC|nr:hypothetical protein BS50DRAFT_210205 [Corynespora cassiicola Philippines]